MLCYLCCLPCTKLTALLAQHRWEIASWLVENNNGDGSNVAPFVILDDDAPEPPADEDGVHTKEHQQYTRDLADNVVAPKSHVGLTAADAAKAIAILAGEHGGGGVAVAAAESFL